MTRIEEAFAAAGLRVACKSGKRRYGSEMSALEALLRVRQERIATGDLRDHENHIYPCQQCEGWHLSSTAVVIHVDFLPERAQFARESTDAYIRRLETRISEQRAQLISIHAIGGHQTNREGRKRIQSLTMALGRMTEMWEREARNREALVVRVRELEDEVDELQSELDARPRRWWRRRS